MYVCYDIKGIQSVIFAVPKLQCMIGGSSQIAQFDEFARSLNQPGEREFVFSGGGRGAFSCVDEPAAAKLERLLVRHARQSGLDLRLGRDERLSVAAHQGDRLFPGNLDPLDGEPCRISGLWPVPKSAKRGVHRIIAERLQAARKDELGRGLIDDLRNSEARLLPSELAAAAELRFFRHVAAPSEKEPDLDATGGDDEAFAGDREAEAARCALGGRNRWAVVAMDGNDMGRQFLAFLADQAGRPAGSASDQAEREWVRAMSESLARVTRQALLAAVSRLLRSWVDDGGHRDAWVDDRTLLLPLRPLIVGGDDVTLLVHPVYAFDFVATLAGEFERLGALAAQADERWGERLWPATGGRITISAGVLFAKTSFPLSMAIDYAESLLASAKGAFRETSRRPAPAAVDWESITESLVDAPADRRRRELQFVDPECDDAEIRLTCRPYPLRPLDGASRLAFSDLQTESRRLAEVPPSVLAGLLPALQQPWSRRIAFLASIAKRHSRLKELLWEGDARPGPGWRVDDAGARSTWIPDALSLLDEDRRMSAAGGRPG